MNYRIINPNIGCSFCSIKAPQVLCYYILITGFGIFLNLSLSDDPSTIINQFKIEVLNRGRFILGVESANRNTCIAPITYFQFLLTSTFFKDLMPNDSVDYSSMSQTQSLSYSASFVVYTDRYLSPKGRDVIFCGTHLLPCKSLRYLNEKIMPLTNDHTIKVMHVEGKSMECENILVEESFKLVGINGTPIFNCSQDCKPFLIISQRVGVEKKSEPSVFIKNFEVINAGCSTSVIIIRRANYVKIDSIVFKESMFPTPAIAVHQHSNQFLNITVRNSRFLSAYGICVFKFTNLFLMIDKSKFIGDGTRAIQGISILREQQSHVGTNETAYASSLSVRFTCFRYLTGAMIVRIGKVVNFYMDVRKSQFTHNFIAPYELPWVQMVKSTALGAFYLRLIPSTVQKQMTVQFVDVVFQNNTSFMGGAFFFHSFRQPISTTNLKISFLRCQFTSNRAPLGGAIYVWSSEFPFGSKTPFMQQIHGTIYFLQCVFENNKATKIPKAGCLGARGGAAFCSNFAMNISDTAIINNYASSRGGALYDNGCIIHLVKTIIRIDKRMSRLTFLGQAIYSRGKFVMKDVRIDMKKPILKIAKSPYIWMTGPKHGAHITPHAIPQRVNLACSTGNDIVLEIIKTALFPLFPNWTSAQPPIAADRLKFRCLPCSKTFYSLAYGRATLLNSSLSKIYKIKCNPCPYGGECSGEIKAKADFWGYRSESQDVDTIKFLPCPREYCCQAKNCLTFNSCNENREGILCGKCRKGYAQGLSSAKCIKVSKCGNPVTWTIVILGGIGYLGFLLYLSEISSILKKVLSWKKLNKQTELEGSSAQSQTASVSLNNTLKENFVFSGLIKVIFFFFQTEPLIRVGQSPSSRHRFLHMAETLRTFYTNAINFQISTFCPFKIVSPVVNHVLSAGFPFLLLALLGLLSIGFFTVKTFKRSVFRGNNNQLMNTATTFKYRLVSCLVNLILLSYATITKTAFALLNCAPINQVQVLYIDGTITCYTTWQYTVAAFTALFIFPLPLGLDLATRQLKQQNLTVWKFIFYLFLPIFCVLSTFFRLCAAGIPSFVTRQNKESKVQRGVVDRLSEENQQLLELMSSIQESQMACRRSAENQVMAQPCSEEPQTSWQSQNSFRGSQIISQEDPDELIECQESCFQDSLSQHNPPTSGRGFVSKDRDNFLEAVLRVIDFPFSSKQEQYKINWESILIARRLVLILLFTFIPYPTLRNILILIMCVIMVLHSACANPYASNFVNKSEVISLLILTILCLINSLIAFSHETNSHLQGYLRNFPEVFSWTETLLLDILPSAILIVVTTIIVLRLLLFLCTMIFKGIQLLVVTYRGDERKLDEHRYILIES